MNNVDHELEAYVHIFESEDSTARMSLEAMINIKRTFIPVFTKILHVLDEAGNTVALIGSV